MSDLIVEVTDANFDYMVLNHTEPVLVYFWASWSGPCQTMATLISDLALEFGEQMVFAACNYDTEPATVQQYDVDSLPTLILFNKGKPVEVMVDPISSNTIAESIQNVLGVGQTP